MERVLNYDTEQLKEFLNLLELRDPETYTIQEQVEYTNVLKNILDDKLLLEEEAKVKALLRVFEDISSDQQKQPNEF